MKPRRATRTFKITGDQVADLRDALNRLEAMIPIDNLDVVGLVNNAHDILDEVEKR